MADDAAVCVWDVNDPTRTTSPQLVLRGHTGPVFALAALADGRLASGGVDQVIRIWNVAGGILEAVTPVATLEGHTSSIYCLASLGDDRLASGGDDKSIIIWNLADGAQRTKLEGHSDPVRCLAALDGDRLASGSFDNTIIIWNLADGSQLATLEGHTSRVVCLAKLDGDTLVSGSSDESVIIWTLRRRTPKLTEGTKLATLKGHTGDVRCLAKLANDRLPRGLSGVSSVGGIERFASGGGHFRGRENFAIRTWNADGKQLAMLEGHTRPVLCLATIDDDRLASGSDDNSVIIWNLADGAQLAKLEGHTNTVSCLAALDGGRLASGGAYVDKKKEKGTALSAINDSCKTGVDRFGSRPLAGAIVEVVEGASPPVCVGLYAKWGRGKSFLIHQIKQHFDPTARVDPRGGGQIVQHFEPGYDNLEEAVTEKAAPKVKAAEPSRPTCCSTILGFISNAVFSTLMLLLWCFYKKETTITIIDTVVEMVNGLRAIAKDLSSRATKVRNCVMCATNDDEVESQSRLLSDESPREVEREYIFVDFNAWEYAQSDELWTGLVKKMYAAVELRLSKNDLKTFSGERKGPNDAQVVTSLARGDWKTAWRVKRAKELLTTADEWSTWGLRLRALLMVLAPPCLTALTLFVVLSGILDFAGVQGGLNIFTKIRDSFTSLKNFFDLVAVSAAPIVAGIATYKAGMKTDEVAGKSRGEAFFEEARLQDSVKDRLGFLARVKNEVTELFSFLHTLEEETGTKLIIVPFVDDLDRVMGGNGDRVTKVLEAVSLILSIDNAPVVTFLAIDPRIVISSIEDGFGAVIQDAKVTGWEYLDKIVQFPIAIPQPASVKVERFVSYVVDPSDAKPGAVATRLLKFVKTAHEIEETSSLDGYIAVFPGEQNISLRAVVNLIESLPASDTFLVRRVARSLDSTRDVEKLIASIGEEGLEMTCRSLNDAFRAVRIINKDDIHESDSDETDTSVRATAPPANAQDYSEGLLPQQPSATQVGLVQLKNFSDGGDLSERIQATLVPSFDESALLVSAAEQVTLRAFAKQTSGNPRRLKRVVNLFQLAVAYAKRLALDEKDPTQTVFLDSRWPLFACKLVKFIVLCEEHPIRMSLLISLLADVDQKAEVNKCIDGQRKAGDMYKFLADDHQTPATRLDPSMLLATFYYKSVDPLYFLQQDVSRNLMQDGDPENFAMLLSMQLPEEAISTLPIKDLFEDAGDFDLVVRDLTGQEGALSLLDYALNLSPALRDTITRDVAQNVSEFEPRLKREPQSLLRRSTADPYDASLRESSVQPKAAYLMQPPKIRE